MTLRRGSFLNVREGGFSYDHVKPHDVDSSFGRTLLCCPPTSYAQARCSMATVAGDWAATLTGTIIFPAPPGPVPAAAVLRYHISADGTVSGIELRNVGGQFVKETLKGTGTVNANCVGTATANIYQGGVLARTVVLSAVYDELSTQVRMVQQSLTLPDGTTIPVVVTVEGKKLASE